MRGVSQDVNSGPGLPACWEWMPGGSELREKDALTGREGVKVVNPPLAPSQAV